MFKSDWAVTPKLNVKVAGIHPSKAVVSALTVEGFTAILLDTKEFSFIITAASHVSSPASATRNDNL